MNTMKKQWRTYLIIEINKKKWKYVGEILQIVRRGFSPKHIVLEKFYNSLCQARIIWSSDCMYGQPVDWWSSAKRVYVLRKACERYTWNKSRNG
jgi:hypothetical protein